jgi:hypothetical protein
MGPAVSLTKHYILPIENSDFLDKRDEQSMEFGMSDGRKSSMSVKSWAMCVYFYDINFNQVRLG